MTGCKQGERKAQEAIYERFAPKMYALCLRYAGSPDDAQDVLQNGFIKMFRKLDDFRGEGSFDGWLRRLMVTSAIEYCRRIGRGVWRERVCQYGENRGVAVLYKKN